MKFKDCKKLLEQTFMNLGAYTTDARNISLMIIAHESGRGQYRKQLKADKPALGLAQIEYNTFNDILNYSDRIKSYLVRTGYNPDEVLFSQLENDDVLTAVFIRARLAMDIHLLPITPKAQADWCKLHWNGNGKATAEKYLSDWELWRNE